jgi:single-strand DNA-binding protein
MPAYNHVLLLGNLTNDPQLSYTPNQTAVADVGLAVNRKWTAGDGTKKEEVCFVDVRAFGTLAEVLVKYTCKGSLVLVSGYLTFEQWVSKDQSKHSKHRIIAQSVQFLTPAGSRVEAGDEIPANADAESPL